MWSQSVQQDGGSIRTTSLRKNVGALYTSVNNAYVFLPTPFCEQQDVKRPATAPPLEVSITAFTNTYNLLQQMQNTSYSTEGRVNEDMNTVLKLEEGASF